MPARIAAPRKPEADLRIPLPDWIATAQPDVPPPAPPAPRPATEFEAVPQRPLGVAVLAVVDGMLGALGIAAGLGAISVGSAILNGLLAYEGVFSARAVGTTLAVLGAGTALLGVYGLALAVGVRRGRAWAWKGSMFLTFLAVGAGLLAAPALPHAGLAARGGAGVVVYMTRGALVRHGGGVAHARRGRAHRPPAPPPGEAHRALHSGRAVTHSVPTPGTSSGGLPSTTLRTGRYTMSRPT
jgi:hypothetical protein